MNEETEEQYWNIMNMIGDLEKQIQRLMLMVDKENVNKQTGKDTVETT